MINPEEGLHMEHLVIRQFDLYLPQLRYKFILYFYATYHFKLRHIIQIEEIL